jgi:hypothetical protein
MSQKNKPKDYNLRDYIWEEEEFKFQPKQNRHKKFLHAKKRQLQKEHYADTKDIVISFEKERFMAKCDEANKRIAYEDYDIEDDDFVRYRIK